MEGPETPRKISLSAPHCGMYIMVEARGIEPLRQTPCKGVPYTHYCPRIGATDGTRTHIDLIESQDSYSN
jgi:hypothetical protein